VRPTNAELYPKNVQIIPRALRALAARGLISVKYQQGSGAKFGRAITVKR
jgi:hypothetical protein